MCAAATAGTIALSHSRTKQRKEVLSGTAPLELDIVLKLFRFENLQKVLIENSKYRRGKTTL
jgi:hypothetical protein